MLNPTKIQGPFPLRNLSFYAKENEIQMKFRYLMY